MAHGDRYAIHPRAVGGYLGVEGLHVEDADDARLDGMKRIRVMSGPAVGITALFDDADLTLLPERRMAYGTVRGGGGVFFDVEALDEGTKIRWGLGRTYGSRVAW